MVNPACNKTFRFTPDSSSHDYATAVRSYCRDQGRDDSYAFGFEPNASRMVFSVGVNKGHDDW